MKNTSACVSAIAVGFVLMSRAIAGHHGDAGRYEDVLTTVSGTVIELQLVNPHSILVVEVKDAAGKVVIWRGELGSPLALRGWCWTRDVVKPGEKITIVGRRLKNGQPYMTLSEKARVITAAGKEIFRGNEPGQTGEPGPCAGAGAR
jgi:Family of unknown function (DUF6152)